MGDSLDATIAAGELAREERRERHARWFAENMAVLRASGLRFAERPTSVLFREKGKPRVDFYPSTGRWRIVGAANGPTRPLSGGAAKFIAWYAKQEVPRGV